MVNTGQAGGLGAQHQSTILSVPDHWLSASAIFRLPILNWVSMVFRLQ